MSCLEGENSGTSVLYCIVRYVGFVLCWPKSMGSRKTVASALLSSPKSFVLHPVGTRDRRRQLAHLRAALPLIYIAQPLPPTPPLSILSPRLPGYARCTIVSMLFTHGGALAKELSLRVPLAPSPGAHPTTLLHVVLRWLELATSHPGTSATAPNAPSSADEARLVGRAAADAGVSLMRLVCGWVYGCPAAARELLQNPANLFVIDVAAGRCALLGGEGGDKAGGATAAQRVAVKGLACVMLGLLLEYVEGGAAPRSGGAGDAEWTRGLVMKMIQNRVGEFQQLAGFAWKLGMEGGGENNESPCCSWSFLL